ncbi:MAG: hypothetical protein WCT77_09745 [Bacteroidota bacterium]
MSENQVLFEKKKIPLKLSIYGILILIIGVILAVIGTAVDPVRTYFNSVIGFTFVFSIGIASLFLVALEYLAGAVWSVPFRRISEILAGLLFFVPLLAVPVFINPHGVFHWSDPAVLAQNPAINAKAPYLNMTFFIIRNIAIFAVAILFYLIITRNSQKQDVSANQNLTKINIRLSAVFMPFFAITITVMSIDWLMSLEPHWFSTIFGVYYFSGSLLAALAALTLIAVYLHERGYLMKGLNSNHFTVSVH